MPRIKIPKIIPVSLPEWFARHLQESTIPQETEWLENCEGRLSPATCRRRIAELNALSERLAQAVASTIPSAQDNPRYPVTDWQYEVVNGDTRCGYLEWVEAKAESDQAAGESA